MSVAARNVNRMKLTDTEQAVLDFEHHTWARAGAKDAATWDTFGWLPARHAQVVLALIDREEALEYAPLLVSRLRRLRDARERARSYSRRIEHMPYSRST